MATSPTTRFANLGHDEIVDVIDGIFANVASLFPAARGRQRGWGCNRREDICWVVTDPPSEYPNFICAARFDAENADTRIAEIANAIKAGKLPALWAVGPRSLPADLGNRLENAGFSPFIRFPGMACDLRSSEEDDIASSPLRLHSMDDQLDILRVRTEAEFSQWIRANREGFHAQFRANGCDEGVYRHLLDPEFEPENRFYLARLNGRMVGAAQAVFYDLSSSCPYVELHQCSVIPEYRQMGIARRLVSRPLLEARTKGCMIASIFADPAAADPFWRSMGFQEYCQLVWYLLE